jgi:PAS domain S-box-containing protein
VEAKPEHPAQEIKQLQRCMNDLVSVLALPAMWSGGKPSQIIHTLLDALLPMLELDLVYVRLKEPLGDAPLELARFASSLNQVSRATELGETLNQWFGDGPQKWPPVARKSVGTDNISVASMHLGLNGEIGVIVAGSQRSNFPVQAERLLLNIAANQASLGLQEARLLSQQKSLANELDRRVAERTAELAAANEELRKEIGERRKIEERLLEGEAALQKAFEEIKKSEAKFRQVFDAIPTLAWCNFPDGPNEFLNKRWHDYTGLSPEESHGWGWQAAFHAEDLPPLLKRWGELLISGEPGEIEARLRRFDGVYRWFLISVEPLHDEAGQIVRWYGTSTDIEDRKRAEQALRESEAQLRRTVDAIPGLVCTMSLAGEITTLNRPLLEFFGKTPEELKNWQMTDAVHPDDLPRVVTTYEFSIRTGTPYEVEHRCRRADGAYRWFQVRALPVHDTDGQNAGWYVLLTDIDDRKRAEEALLASENNLRKIVDGIPGLLCTFNPAGKIELANRQLLKYFGLTVEEMNAWATNGMVYPDDLRRIMPTVADTFKIGTPFDEQLRYRRADGVYRWFQVRIVPVQDTDGRITGFYGLITDIEDRKHAEEELRRIESELAHASRVMSLGVLTASIAHEINQPLSGIVTNSGTCLRMLAADPPNVDGARETAKRTIRDGHRVSDVVARLRALFSKKSGTIEPIDLNEAAREVIAMSLGGLQKNRVALRLDLDDELPIVRGDRIQLQQVILNLIRNASDAMSTVEDRPRQLLIRTERDEGNRVRLTVQDSGIGFAPHVVERLFEAFYTTKNDGMGVGLSVSKSIIEIHQGRLWATLNDGPGATFSFSIPCPPESSASSDNLKVRPF